MKNGKVGAVIGCVTEGNVVWLIAWDSTHIQASRRSCAALVQAHLEHVVLLWTAFRRTHPLIDGNEDGQRENNDNTVQRANAQEMKKKKKKLRGDRNAFYQHNTQ